MGLQKAGVIISKLAHRKTGQAPVLVAGLLRSGSQSLFFLHLTRIFFKDPKKADTYFRAAAKEKKVPMQETRK